MAKVIDEVLYGESAQAATGAKNKSAAVGIAWAVGIAIVAAAIYAMFSTGSFGGTFKKLGRHASEMTAGLIGKKK